MKRVLDAANRCIEDWSWKEMAVLKVCVGAAGLMAGLLIPRKKRRRCFMIALLVFIVTMVPLAVKFWDAFKEE